MGDGDRVALISYNSHRYVEFLFAPQWGGGVAVPINHRLSIQELIAQLRDCEPVVLLVDRSFHQCAEPLLKEVPSISHVLFADDGPVPDGLADYEAALADATPVEASARADDDLACLFYTGGTTGQGKGVMLSHDNIYSYGLNLVALLGLDEESVHFHCGPLFHVAPGVRIFAASIAAARHVVLDKFSPARALAEIERCKVTVATFVPTMIGMLLRLRDFARYDLSSLKVVTYGGAPMPEAVVRELMERLPGVSLGQLYGQTEVSPCTFLSPRDHTAGYADGRLLRSGGRAVFSAEVRIVDATDSEAPHGEVGEIVARGPMMMKGYWRNATLTAQALRGGWMHTGDAGYMDDDGYLFVVDRVKDMIVSGGENVYSIEVENVIHKHPDIYQCAVIGIPEDLWGEAVHAIVVLREGRSIEPEAIIDFCRVRIAHYKCPRSVEISLEPLPLSGANKINKVALRHKYWGGKVRKVN